MTVKLLCHFDGTDGQTTTTDLAGDPHKVNLSGCTLTTTGAKFGSACLDLNAGPSTAFAFSMGHADWNFGAGQFTVEAWVKFDVAPSGLHVIASQWEGNCLSWMFTQYGTTLNFYYSTTGTSGTDFYGSHTPVLGQWYHYAVDRDAAGMIRIYVDGVVKASQSVPSTLFSSKSVLRIGNDHSGIRKFQGKLDDLRISDTAQYAGAFTPPTAAFPDPPALTPAPATIRLLCHFNGVDGATTTTDSGEHTHPVTMVGTSIEGSGPKFGTGSMTTDPSTTTARTSITSSNDFWFGGEEFTIESWVKFTAAPSGGGNVIASQWGGNNAMYLGMLSGMNFYWTAENESFSNIGAAFTPTLNQWYHVAVDRDGAGMLRLYIDGAVIASVLLLKSIVKSTLPDLTLGNENSQTRCLRGELDEFRIMNRAMYAGAFTPPTQPFSDPAPVASPARITQAAVLAIGETIPGINVTQAALLALSDIRPSINISQMPVLALVEFLAEIRVSQIGALLLADHVPCVTRWAQTWTITRTDGEVFAFTSLDRALNFRGVMHQPCASLSASSTEQSTTVGSNGNMELIGIISDAGISERDLYNGLFDFANFEVWMVPWENAGGEIPFRLLGGTTGSMSQGINGFRFEVLTDAAKLKQKGLLETFSPSCRYNFGSANDARCPVDLSTITAAGTITSVAVPAASNAATRRVAIDSARAEIDGHFDLGVITFLTGQNAGAKSEIKRFEGGVFVLWSPLLYPIAAGDTYTATPGCNKSSADHLKWNADMLDFGGFPDVPGGDAISQTPDSKG